MSELETYILCLLQYVKISALQVTYNQCYGANLAMKQSDNKFARLLVIAVAVLHAAMALTIKILFFG